VPFLIWGFGATPKKILKLQVKALAALQEGTWVQLTAYPRGPRVHPCFQLPPGEMLVLLKTFYPLISISLATCALALVPT